MKWILLLASISLSSPALADEVHYGAPSASSILPGVLPSDVIASSVAVSVLNNHNGPQTFQSSTTLNALLVTGAGSTINIGASRITSSVTFISSIFLGTNANYLTAINSVGTVNNILGIDGSNYVLVGAQSGGINAIRFYNGSAMGEWQTLGFHVGATGAPGGKLEVVPGTTNPYSVLISSGDGSTLHLGVNYTQGGHVESGGVKPVVSACGTDPTNVGSDTAGKVTIGTGGVTSCTVTFAMPFTNAPSCTITANATLVTAATSATVLTISHAVDMSAAVIMYHCIGQDGG